VILGDDRAPGDFARTFVVGAVVAALGGIGALMMDRR